jgi:hypothetical protein
MGNADADATAYNKNGIKREKGLYLFIYLNGEKYFGGGDNGFFVFIISYSHFSK